MIHFYSGTPGSGKSLHVASKLYWWIRAGKPCICNFPLNLERFREKVRSSFVYKDNSELTPEFLIDYANDYIAAHGAVKEDSILLVIDECQLIFNSRDWGQKGRDKWLRFFTLHRHLGYMIILVAQFDRMIDRQIRSLIEYEYIHRKLSNYGWRGWFLSAVFLSRKMFVSVKVWYPMREKVGSEFFRAKKFYYSLYDSYGTFAPVDSRKGLGGPAEGPTGSVPNT